MNPLYQPGIYLITNLVNGKKYIGQSQNIGLRWNSHKSRRKSKQAIASAISKYGVENFGFDVIEFCSVEQLDELEKVYIEFADSVAPKGYNIAPAGNSSRGVRRSQEFKDNLSRIHQGVPKSEETKRRMSEARTGITLSEETKAKISKVMMGDQRNKGKVRSEEAKLNMSIAQKKRFASERKLKNSEL